MHLWLAKCLWMVVLGVALGIVSICFGPGSLVVWTVLAFITAVLIGKMFGKQGVVLSFLALSSSTGVFALVIHNFSPEFMNVPVILLGASFLLGWAALLPLVATDSRIIMDEEVSPLIKKEEPAPQLRFSLKELIVAVMALGANGLIAIIAARHMEEGKFSALLIMTISAYLLSLYTTIRHSPHADGGDSNRRIYLFLINNIILLNYVIIVILLAINNR